MSEIELAPDFKPGQMSDWMREHPGEKVNPLTFAANPSSYSVGKTTDLEQAIARAREWRDKAVAKANDRHAAELIKIQAQFERRLRKIEAKVEKVGSL